MTTKQSKRVAAAASVAIVIGMLIFMGSAVEGRADGVAQRSSQPAAHGTPVIAAMRADDGADSVRARIEQLGADELKAIYRHCAREAVAQRLGNGEIALCSVAYEVLLHKHFAGEFLALLAWSRQP